MTASLRTWAVVPLFAVSVDTMSASPPLSASDLYESCTAHVEAPRSPEALVCASYIQGYLDSARSGAEIFAERTTRCVTPESWEERAARTRLGKNYWEGLRKRDHRFCLPESATVEDIVRQFIEYLRTHPSAPSSSAAEALAGALRLHHSCGQ